MPIREFKCAAGHTTEKILYGLDDVNTYQVVCGVITKDGPTLDDREYCGEVAERVDISMTGATIFVEGNGGFHKPTLGAKPTNHNTSSVNEFIRENKIHKQVAGRISKQLKGQ